MKSTIKTLVAALAFGSTLGFASSASAGVIDLFSALNANQSVSSNTNGVTVTNELIVGGTDIVGGARDLVITPTAGTSGATRNASLAVEAGTLSWNNDTGVTSVGRIQWDGHDAPNEATPDVLNYTGLGGISLYDGCGGPCVTLSAIINSADHGFTYQIGIYTSSTQYTLLDSGTLFAITSPYDSTYDLSWFGLIAGAHTEDGLPFFLTHGSGGAANLSNVGALEFVLLSGTNADIDFELESLQTVPEPTSLLLFGLGLAGLATLRRRKQT